MSRVPSAASNTDPAIRRWLLVGLTEPTDPAPPCQPGSPRAGSTWFEFTPAATGSYTFSTCTDVNTVVSIYTGPACGPYTALSLSCGTIGGEDSDCGIGTTSVTASLSAGQTLRIFLTGVVAENVGPVRLTVALGASTPRVDRIDVVRGSVGGGVFVVIDGRGFAAGAAVSFGGAPATEVAVLGSTALTARTPPHAAGVVDVSVTIPGGGTGAFGNGFRYEALESANRSPVDLTQTHAPARIVPPR